MRFRCVGSGADDRDRHDDRHVGATAGRTVTIKVDHDADGFGVFGTTTPTGLTAGTVRLVLAAAEDNPEPVDVLVLDADDDDMVFEFVGVPGGVSRGADVEPAAGTYGVRHGTDEKSFEVS
ncbi:MAG: hypothetical protein QM733_17710 [Ilumatobacteraceae bacterium]